jgi:hypothetical protein
MLAQDLMPKWREPVLHGEGGAEGSVRMVLVGDRSAEKCHDTVAQELVDGAFEEVHGVKDHLEGTVHDGMYFFGVQSLGHGSEA